MVTGCQMVNYTYRYVNQANGNPNWQPYPGTPIAVADGALYALTNGTRTQVEDYHALANCRLAGYLRSGTRPRRID